MPTTIGRTEDGRDILREAPEEGCRYRCTTCGNWLHGRTEVRGHWLLSSQGHSVFEDAESGKAHHQTIEGLFERDWGVVVAPGGEITSLPSELTT